MRRSPAHDAAHAQMLARRLSQTADGPAVGAVLSDLMGGGMSDAHREQAGRAERLAEKALRRMAAARVTADEHEQLTSDESAGEWHQRAAAFYRDSELIYEQAVALQTAHATHERQAGLQTSAAYHFTHGPRQRAGLSDRYAALAHREALADQRDRTADARELAADERDRTAEARELAADERDRTADVRDAVATAREDQIDAHERVLDLFLPSLRFAADQRAQLERIHAAILRTKEQILRGAHALHRDDPHTELDEIATGHQPASSQRHRPPEPT
jgi:hypothetical protein